MKIRDTRKYIESICGTSSLAKLGTDQDELLQAMYGLDQQIDAAIGESSNFANNAEEQLFYEFVQNAFDAKAKALMFYANEKYLIVLNNGVPFYTEPYDKVTKKEEGQLYNFLAKGKSRKYGDNSLMGQYGQGSKLMYTLMTSVSGEKTKDLLVTTIKRNKKGPYLISWNSRDQLDELLLDRGIWEYVGPDNVTNGILVVKIVMSYYPILPGIDETLFSSHELSEAIKAFDTLVDPRRNINRLKQGTALIIPLGDGKFERINNPANLDNVKVRLAGFASVTAGKPRFKGRRLDNISVLGAEIKQIESSRINVMFELDGQDFGFDFAFSPQFSAKESVNFYNALPILDTKYGLGFIIDSQDFETDGSRQRLLDTKKTELYLRHAFKGLVDKLTELKREDLEAFDAIYTSLINTNIPDGADYEFVRNPFFDIIVPFLKENVRTNDGSYVPFDKIYYKDGELKNVNVAFAHLGITDKHWIDDGCRKAYREHFKFSFIGKSKTYQNLVDEANQDCLIRWLRLLNEKEYAIVHQLSSKLALDGYRDNKLFRTNKGRILSYNEIVRDQTAFVINDVVRQQDVFSLDDLEFVLNPGDNNSTTTQLTYVIGNIEYFRKSFFHKEKCCLVLSRLLNSNPKLIERIRNEVQLLENRSGRRLPFGDLLLTRPNNTILYDEFCVKGTVPENADKSWFATTDQELWQWTKRNIHLIKELPNWMEYAMDYLRDIKRIFEMAHPNAQSVASEDRIGLCLEHNGIPSNDEYCLISSQRQLTDDDYLTIARIFPAHKFVGIRFRRILSLKPFDVKRVKVEDLIREGQRVSKRELECITRFATGFISKFWVESVSSDTYTFHQLAGGQKNFIYVGDIDEPCMRILSEAGYYRLPKCVVAVLSFDENKMRDLNLRENQKMMIDVIDKVYNPIDLLPLVIPCGSAVHNEYIHVLAAIEVCNKIPYDNVVWQLIRFAGNYGYQDKLFEKLRHRGKKLPTSIYDNRVEYNKHQYDLFELLPAEAENDKMANGFLECLPDPYYFRQKYYKDKQVKIPPCDIYQKLFGQKLSLTQLRFVLDYVTNENRSGASAPTPRFELQNDSLLSEALSMIDECKYEGFDRYLVINGYTPNRRQVYCDDDLLTADERLPKVLKDWLDRNHTAHLMRGLGRWDSNYIQFRKAVLNDEPFSAFDFNSDKECFLRTIKWIALKQFSIQEDSNRFLDIELMTEHYPKDMTPLYLMRYRGLTADGNELKLLFGFEQFSSPSYFLCRDDCNTSLAERMADSKIKQFFLSNRIYYALSRHWIKDFGLVNAQDITIYDASEPSRFYQEWDNPIYRQWTQTRASEGIRVYLSSRQIPVRFTVNIVGISEPIFRQTIQSKDFGYNSNERMVVIKYPESSGESVIKTLAKCSPKIDFFKSPFIHLQSLFLEQYESAEKIAMDQGISVEELISRAVSSNGGEVSVSETQKQLPEAFASLDDDDKSVLANNIGAIKNIIDNLDVEDIQTIAENIGLIKEILEEKLGAVDQEKESLVRQTIGYIGELIYLKYLGEKLGKDIDYAADRGVAEYDVLNISDNVYVDVKTTLYSLKDGTAPFYLHRTQNVFMQKNPDAKYRIVRISLKDLALEQSYLEIRDKYGKDADPRMDEHLQRACQKLADKYWRTARMEEFEHAVPQYRIRIEKSDD